MALFGTAMLASLAAGCAHESPTFSQGAYEVTAGFASALAYATHYATLPRCPRGVGSSPRHPCAERPLLRRIEAVAVAANVRVHEMQDAARDPDTPEPVVRQAIKAANRVVFELLSLIPHP